MGTSRFGPGGVMLEASVRHDTANGLAIGNTAGEVLFGIDAFDPSLRIADYNSPFFVKNVTNLGAGGGVFLPMARSLDTTHYLLHRIGWAPGSVAFSLANDTPETIATNIPTQALAPMFASVAIGRTTTLSIDWVRVRSWVGAEALATIGAEED